MSEHQPNPPETPAHARIRELEYEIPALRADGTFEKTVETLRRDETGQPVRSTVVAFKGHHEAVVVQSREQERKVLIDGLRKSLHIVGVAE